MKDLLKRIKLVEGICLNHEDNEQLQVVYKILHPVVSDCKHSDWEEETKKMMELLNIK